MPEVIMPKMGDAMEEGTLLEWKKQDGETVKSGDVIAEIETDKSNVEIEAEDAGILHVKAEAGAVLPVGTIIAIIGDDVPARSNGGGSSKPAASVPASNSLPPAQQAERKREAAAEYDTLLPATASAPQTLNGSSSVERLKASPLARSVAKQRGLDIAQITGTGPLGRIVEADVIAFATSAPASAPSTAVQSDLPPAEATSAAPQKRASVTPAPLTTPTELSAMRKVIARRMVESKTTIPHFYITAEVDMAEAMALREKLNAYDETLTKISLNDMIVKASGKALVKFPAVNAVYKDENIYPGAGVHVGVAVALDDGLIVPVVRDADSTPLRQLAQNTKSLVKKARDKKLQPSEYSGGTFTVSNLGPFDVESFIAIIDPSQGAILAVSSIVKRAVVLDNDVIAVRPRMNLTFSGDHRVMDGATGARFLQELKRLLQNPLSLME
ncbi:MAG: dihydrolipoamide acetyltransferase family protein [Janthinobacterium lividum]